MKPRWCILGLAMLVAFTLEGQETTLFKSGDLGYACFRIPALATPMCQSSILRQGNKLYHCGPADTATRSRLLLQKSENFGQSWEPVEMIWMGSAAYCDVVAVAPGSMGVFYERQGYSEMVWTQVVLDP